MIRPGSAHAHAHALPCGLFSTRHPRRGKRPERRQRRQRVLARGWMGPWIGRWPPPPRPRQDTSDVPHAHTHPLPTLTNPVSSSRRLLLCARSRLGRCFEKNSIGSPASRQARHLVCQNRRSQPWKRKRENWVPLGSSYHHLPTRVRLGQSRLFILFVFGLISAKKRRQITEMITTTLMTKKGTNTVVQLHDYLEWASLATSFSCCVFLVYSSCPLVLQSLAGPTSTETPDFRSHLSRSNLTHAPLPRDCKRQCQPCHVHVPRNTPWGSWGHAPCQMPGRARSSRRPERIATMLCLAMLCFSSSFFFFFPVGCVRGLGLIDAGG